MTAQDVISQVSTDIRKVLSDSGADATLILGWVDRIHKDVLHSSIYSYLNEASTTVATVAGTSSYALVPTDIRRILNVYDRTFDRTLLPLDVMTSPVSSADNATSRPGQVQEEVVRPFKSALALKTQGPWPEYYKLIGTQTFRVFPAPATANFASTLEIYYEKQVANVIATGTTLVVPDDAEDIMVAGVNYLACQYLKKGDEAQAWFAVYEKLKKGEGLV